MITMTDIAVRINTLTMRMSQTKSFTDPFPFLAITVSIIFGTIVPSMFPQVLKAVGTHYQGRASRSRAGGGELVPGSHLVSPQPGPESPVRASLGRAVPRVRETAERPTGGARGLRRRWRLGGPSTNPKAPPPYPSTRGLDRSEGGKSESLPRYQL